MSVGEAGGNRFFHRRIRMIDIGGGVDLVDLGRKLVMGLGRLGEAGAMSRRLMMTFSIGLAMLADFIGESRLHYACRGYCHIKKILHFSLTPHLL